jgi:colanic acid biosynthesis glycosyl transferase WcaI
METTKRLTLVSLNFHPEPTGIGPYATALAKNLSSEFSLHVIAGIPHYPSWQKEPFDDSEILKDIRSLRRLAHVVPRTNAVLGRLLLELSFALKAAVANWKSPDALLLTSPSLLAAAVSIVRARFFHRETVVVLWLQDLYGQGSKEIFKEKRVVQRIISWVEKKTLARADSVVVIHESFKEILESEFGVSGSRIEVIPNWSQFSFNPNLSKADTARKFGLRDMPTVLHAGNMGRKQALEFAILAADHSSKFQLLLVGDGAMKTSLQELGKDLDNVLFLPPVSEVDLSNLLNFSDILLVNESSDTGKMAMPSKLTTYMRAGKPIIAATTPNSNCALEILKSASGIIVEPGNSQALSASIDLLLSDMHTRNVLAKNGKSYSDRAYGSESILAKFREHINAILR